MAVVQAATAAGGADAWQQQHDELVARLRALDPIADHWGAGYAALYRAALPWYERWGGNPRHDVDDWMEPPEQYATELADALEHGRNFFAENPGALVPLDFTATLTDGRTTTANYWISLPAGFPGEGRTFPLIISLHGSGWLGHKLSFVRQARKDVSGGRTFTVTPIDEAGPWQIEFLNAFLDELLHRFPVDPDRVYVEGHSLGAMATWEWALNNPERFAAISPRAGRGEPYRAGRLRRVPAWVIHGENDGVVFTGFSDQMVTALEDCGAPVRYTILAGVEHNMPDDLDEGQVVDWYLRQTRDHEPPPPDPRDVLGISEAGFSPWVIIATKETQYWTSEPVAWNDRDASLRAVQELFRKARAHGARVDSPLLERLETKTNRVTFWLETPRMLRLDAAPAAGTVTLPAGHCARWYFRGETPKALEHVTRVAAEARDHGAAAADVVWITPLSLWPDTPSDVAEYRIAVP